MIHPPLRKRYGSFGLPKQPVLIVALPCVVSVPIGGGALIQEKCLSTSVKSNIDNKNILLGGIVTEPAVVATCGPSVVGAKNSKLLNLFK